MNFVMRMAQREIRSSWRRLLFFFVCIGVGVGSIVCLALNRAERQLSISKPGASAAWRRRPD